jgi:hypothetical protein
LGIGPEVRGAFNAVGGDVGRAVASGGNLGKGALGATQKGDVNPAVFAEAFRGATKAGKLSKAATGVTAAERGAERVGRAAERTHKTYMAEKVSGQEHEREGRDLFAGKRH